VTGLSIAILVVLGIIVCSALRAPNDR
jgi:hypothetical protein